MPLPRVPLLELHPRQREGDRPEAAEERREQDVYASGANETRESEASQEDVVAPEMGVGPHST